MKKIIFYLVSFIFIILIAGTAINFYLDARAQKEGAGQPNETNLPNGNNTQKSIAEQIKECLPKSDTESHTRCLDLISQIRNFDECEAAGFAIAESYPLQCFTLDGRGFTKETNSTWEQVVEAINNCQVKNSFQNHSKIVKVTLKNGAELIAAEPVIDEVFAVIQNVKDKCGTIPMATE